MSKSSGRRWLVISYFSGIDGMACSQHIDDRLPHLKRLGIEPILLTSICGRPAPDVDCTRALCAAPSGIRYEIRHLKRKGPLLWLFVTALTILIGPFYWLEKLLVNLDSQWSWFPFPIWKGLLLLRKQKPELIYSTGGPCSAHIAAAVLAGIGRIPWIAELQDPLVHGEWSRSRTALRFYTRIERLICERASAVVFLTREAARNADGRTGVSERAFTIYAGADLMDDPSAHAPGDVFRIGHFGSLSGTRNLDVFLRALDLLLKEDPETREAIKVELYGSRDRLATDQIRAFGREDVLTHLGRVSRDEAVAAMRRTDVLLVIQDFVPRVSETIPAKVYEYLQSGRPILALVDKNPELTSILEERGHIAVDARDPAAVKGGLAKMFERWKIGTLSCAAGPSPYTVEAAVGKLLSIADSVALEASRRVSPVA